MSEAERARLLRVLAEGPERRMAQDRALGMGVQRADEWQARDYRAQLAALDAGAELGPVVVDVVDVRAELDRSGDS